jgi:hypothetical protein
MEMPDGVAGCVRKAHKLCDKDRVHHSRVDTTAIVTEDLTVAEFYEKTYLPYSEDVVPLTSEPRLSMIEGKC